MTRARLTKKFLGLSERLDNLLDESLDIFFEERPFLEDRSKPLVILDLKERREENEISVKAVKEELLKTMQKLGETFQKKTPVTKQESLLPMAE